MPNWKEIQKEWETSKITFKALAEKHNVPEGTLKSRRSREKWSKDAPSEKWSRDATVKKDATFSKGMQPKKKIKEPIELSDELTDMQKAFCFNYINSFNATQSAIKAGYSKDTAHVQGSRLLRNVKVAEEIKRLRGDIQGELFIDATDLTKEYMKMAFADITDFITFGKKEVEVMSMYGPLIDDDGNPVMKEVNYVDFVESDLVDGKLISEVKQGKDGISIKLHDKQKAMQELNKRLLFIEELRAEKLKAETAKIAAETKNEETGSTKTIILTNEDEMRKVIAERKAEKENE